MSQILVDSSIWIAFFRGSIPQDALFQLIDTNQICTNDLILSEIVPSLRARKEKALVDILYRIQCYPLAIEWLEIIDFQVRNIRKGINNVGISDLIIMQNVIQHSLVLYAVDSHFSYKAIWSMNQHANLRMPAQIYIGSLERLGLYSVAARRCGACPFGLHRPRGYALYTCGRVRQ
jgi:predicted nucleic acid-binding protein